jgi:hypothetical protein
LYSQQITAAKKRKQIAKLINLPVLYHALLMGNDFQESVGALPRFAALITLSLE